MRTDRIPLTGDYSVSRVIKGNWQLSTGHMPGQMFDREQAIKDMRAFVDRGITTFDFGDIYLGVEELIGECIDALRKEFGKSARNMIQLHTKYVPDVDTLRNHSFSDVAQVIDRSCKRLRVDVLDLVQFHWWNYQTPGYVDALLHLQTLQRHGKIRLLGVTNFDVSRMQEFLDAGIRPATAQVQYSVLDRRPENGLVDLCRKNDIQLLCYGTVAGGFLSGQYINAPEPVGAFANRSLTKYKLIIDECGGWEMFQELLHALDAIAQKHRCSVSTVASAFVLGKPQVAAVIVGARDRSFLDENARIASLRLDAEDHAAIERVLSRSRGPCGDVYDLERNDAKHSMIMQKQNNRSGDT